MPEQVDTNRILLSTTEAAQFANLSSRYIQRLLLEKRIEGVRIGTVWLVYKDALKTFMDQPRKRGPKGPRNHRLVDTTSSSIQPKETHSSE